MATAMSTHQAFQVACIQNCAGADITENIADAVELVCAAQAAGARMVCLPEFFVYLDADDSRMLANAVPEHAHPAILRFQDLARELGIWILLGSLPIKISAHKVNNRAYLIADDGQIIARYDKIHLFDVNLKSGENYRESETVVAGNQAVVAPTPWGLLGLSICYDLRFPYLYRTLAQAGADFLAIPAAFTQTTGAAHWHVLLRARAIETGCYVFAPCQCGVHPGNRKTYGHSLIVDPWGKVLADGGTAPGFVMAEIDPDKVREARAMIPALQHDRGLERG